MESYINTPKKELIEPHFMLIPSLSCPASCSYCFGPNTGPVMDAAMTNRVVDYIEAIASETRQNKVRVTLHGGEPLAAGYETIETLVKSLHGRFSATGLEIGVQSNLWLLDERYCELFARYRVSLSTSLDGPQELNDGQRGDGCFAKTMRGILLARSYGLKPGCIATFTAHTAPRWKEVFAFFLSENLPFSVHHSVPAIEGTTGYELPPDQYDALFTDMFDEYVLHRREIKIASFDQVCQGVACGDGGVCTFRDCFGMFLAIDPYGDIYSCQRLAGRAEFRLGNIAGYPGIYTLMDSPAAMKLLEHEQEVKRQCGGCEHYSYCKGGCAYNAFARKDIAGAADPFCGAYKNIFSMIKQRLYQDMVSDENIRAISEYGPSEKGNPLLRKGPVIELTAAYTHPYDTANTAQRIVMAYELAKGPGLHEPAERLTAMGLFKTGQAAEAELYALHSGMRLAGRLNKIYLHVTWNCQLRCRHCYACADSGAQADEMQAADIERLVRSAAGCGFKEAVLTGGEPLIHRDRDALLERFASVRCFVKPLKLVLRTNFAIPLTQDNCILLSKAFDEIVVSVDGPKTEHDARRGDGAYDRTVYNLEQYQSIIGEAEALSSGRPRPARLSIAATMKAGEVNSEKGMDVRDLGRRLNIRRVKFRPLLPLGRALNLDEPVVSEALKAYQTPLELIEEGFHPVMSCGIGQNLYVEPSGKAFPCYSYHRPHSLLGNVIRDGLETVIKSESFRVLKGYTVDTNYGCKKCEYRYLCGGACRAWGRESAQADLNAAPVECAGLRECAERLHAAAIDYLFR